GIAEIAADLRKRDIGFLIRIGDPVVVVGELGRAADLLVCDRGYLRVQRDWRNRVAQACDCRVVQIEDNLVVPVETASAKREYAARTIRPKITGRLPQFAASLDLPEAAVRYPPGPSQALPAGFEGCDTVALSRRLNVDRSVAPVTRFYRGGPREALRRLNDFIRDGLSGYEEHRSEPCLDAGSHLSPYLHFGNLSPVRILAAINDAATGNAHREQADASAAAYIDELTVHRELAANFVYYTSDYDSYTALPDWARGTLARHRGDRRSPLYSAEQLEAAQTHDSYWNAAMIEMRETGYMHNYMRMYWGKKVLEWTESPEEAFDTLLAINNRYFLDGRDAASYASVGWIFGLHDRPWKERPVFGTVRYMAASGLERKFDMVAYLGRVEAQVGVSAWRSRRIVD
ncbi:MAG TPA: deoxyribodipyrimidine photo-lyase, partial [Spirochaetia bacterium]|nr:deoxyribodipyrimidine photo-lyase [Spirochaetia bacterium]